MMLPRMGRGSLVSEGSKRPVVYASRTLSKAERNCAHLEKEGLALIVELNQYRSFELITDHKPLFGLLEESKQVSIMA